MPVRRPVSPPDPAESAPAARTTGRRSGARGRLGDVAMYVAM